MLSSYMKLVVIIKMFTQKKQKCLYKAIVNCFQFLCGGYL